ncbi:hypothetical protein OPT61_g6650 [Boeremia exigua]|uniref:Uncharacterized protein n=1 Tax=Boeremia exigua TaxID=749465 RepID=A0ACC2I697_9PLEO|nr:hypothetical protein OPT61_g6650 [Boeremia exigua]
MFQETGLGQVALLMATDSIVVTTGIYLGQPFTSLSIDIVFVRLKRRSILQKVAYAAALMKESELRLTPHNLYTPFGPQHLRRVGYLQDVAPNTTMMGTAWQAHSGSPHVREKLQCWRKSGEVDNGYEDGDASGTDFLGHKRIGCVTGLYECGSVVTASSRSSLPAASIAPLIQATA